MNERTTQKNKVNYDSNNNINNSINNSINNINNLVENNSFKERQKKLDDVKNIFNKNNLQKKMQILDRHTKTTKYKLGKHGKTVSILIKNNTSRKQIKEDISKIKKTSIIDIKNYLRKHNLIKIGSDTPNDVLRQLYEQAILAGDITNINTDNLLHNYLEK